MQSFALNVTYPIVKVHVHLILSMMFLGSGLLLPKACSHPRYCLVSYLCGSRGDRF